MPYTPLYRFPTPRRHPASRVVVVWMGLASSLAAHGQCESSVSTTAVESVLTEATTALASLDVGVFKQKVDEAEAQLRCVDEAVSPQLAAELHRLVGIRAFGNRDPIAERAFAAARYIEPNYEFSQSLIPERNPVRIEYDRAPWHDRATTGIERPASGALYVDGTPSTERPISWPAVIQWVDDSEDVRFTDYLLPGQPLPEYPLWVAPVTPDRKPPTVLVVSSVAAGLASGVLYGVALGQEARYKDVVNQPVPDKQLDDLRRKTNTLVLASAISGTAAIGTGAVIVFAW